MKVVALPRINRRLLVQLTSNTGLLAIAAVLLFTPLRIVSLLLMIGVLARLIPFGSGFFTRLALGFGSLTAFVMFVGVAAWLVKAPLSSGVILALLNLSLWAWALTYLKRGVASGHLLRTNTQDIVAAIVGGAAMLIVLWPVLTLTDAARLVQVVSAGGDNMAHLEIFRADDLNRGLVYGDGSRVPHRQDFKTYPQGWHFNLAFLKWTTQPIVTYEGQPRNLLLLFYGYGALWFGLLVFWMVRLAGSVIESLRKVKRNQHLLALPAMVAVIAAVVLHWLVDLFMPGFQPQIAATTLILIETCLIVEVFRKQGNDRYPALLLATVMAVCASLVWVFVLPVSFALVAIALLATLVQAKRLPPLYVWVALIPLGGLAALQPLLYKLYPAVSSSDIPALLQRGYILNTSMYTLLFLFVVIVVLLLLCWRSTAVRVVTIAAALSLVMSLFLFKYQLNILGELRYFYFKSTYLYIILAAILCSVLAYELMLLLLRKKTALKQRTYQLGLFVAVLTLGVLVCYQVCSPFVGAYLQSKVTGIEASQAWPLVNAVSAGLENGYYTTFIGNCNRGNDIRAVQMARALATSGNPTVTMYSFFATAEHDESKVFKNIASVMRSIDHPLTVISGDQVVGNKFLAYKGIDHEKLVFVSIDTTPETEPIMQCPDRIRDLKKFP